MFLLLVFFFVVVSVLTETLQDAQRLAPLVLANEPRCDDITQVFLVVARRNRVDFIRDVVNDPGASDGAHNFFVGLL